tara:strand:- start:527 stop:1021 length:495 start_codon:yes stop_codon:yes gene_type:complete
MIIPELRWLQPEWIYEASKLEWDSLEKFWTIEQFESILSNKENKKYIVPLVCIIDDKIAGYNIYKLCENSYNIINLVVGSNYRRQGIGSLLVQNLTSKLEESKKHHIRIRVRDTNEDGCEFLERVGFRFSRVVENFFKVYAKTGGTNLKQDAYEYILRKSDLVS